MRINLWTKKQSLGKALAAIDKYINNLRDEDILLYTSKVMKSRLFSIDLNNLGINENDLFEAFNSKTEPLKNFDLITNSIFMKIENDREQINIYKGQWEDKFKCKEKINIDKFFRDYVSMVNIKMIGQKGYDVYQEFKNILNNKITSNKTEIIEEQVIELMNKIVDFFNIYKCIKTDEQLDEYFDKKTSKLKIYEYKFLKVDSADSFIMYLINLFKEDKIEERQFNKIIVYINNYLYKKKIYGPTAQNRKLFIELIQECIKNENEIDFPKNLILNIIIDTINKHNKKNDNLKEISNDVFLEYLKIDLNDYTDSKFFFVFINNRLKITKKIMTLKEYDELSIEHIVPKSFWNNEKWLNYFKEEEVDEKKYKVNKLSNLTILTKKENESCDDKLYELKKNIISGSQYKINNYFLHINTVKDLEDKWFKFLEDNYKKYFKF